MIDQPKQRLRDHIALAEKATKGPWYVGAQNDYPYVIDRAPSPSNDAPNHEADTELVAKPFTARGVGCSENADFIASARTESPANARALLVAIEEIEGAPHKAACWSYYGDPCDCWKSNALARIAEVMS